MAGIFGSIGKFTMTPAQAAMAQTGQPAPSSTYNPWAGVMASADNATPEMKQQAVAQGQMAAPANNPAPSSTPAATAPQVQAAKVDTTAQDASMRQALQYQQSANDNAQKYTQWQNSVQAKNAANNAARAGLKAGGASYLAGSRQSQLTSQNNMANTYAQGAQAMGNIYSAWGGLQSQAANQNAANVQSTNVANWNRQNQLDDATASAAAEQQAKQIATDVENYKVNYDYLFDQGGSEKAGRAQYLTLLNNYAGATPGTPESAAAKQALDAYLAKAYQEHQARKSK